MSKRISILSKQYWINSGLTEEQAVEKVRQLQRSRSPRCIEYWLNKGLNESEAKAKISELQKYNTSLDKRSLEEKRKTSKRSLEYWREQCSSETEAIAAHREFNDFTSIEYHIKKFGVEEGTKRYNQKVEDAKHYNSLDGYIDRYGESIGIEKFYDRFRKTPLGYSTIAGNFFEKLLKDIIIEYPEFSNMRIMYASKPSDREFSRIVTRNNKKSIYFYDFVIFDLQLCIEFNGSIWHGDPRFYNADDVIKFKEREYKVSDIWDYDKEKIAAIEDYGYEAKILWFRHRSELKTLHIEAKQYIITKYKHFLENKK